MKNLRSKIFVMSEMVALYDVLSLLVLPNRENTMEMRKMRNARSGVFFSVYFCLKLDQNQKREKGSYIEETFSWKSDISTCLFGHCQRSAQMNLSLKILSIQLLFSLLVVMLILISWWKPKSWSITIPKKTSTEISLFYSIRPSERLHPGNDLNCRKRILVG